MVLVLIVVAGISMVGLSRKSLELARQAATAQENLQRRWGVKSCQRLVLAQAEKLMEKEAQRYQTDDTGWPLPASVSGEFTLGRLQFSFLLADEDSKVNLNVLHGGAQDGVSRVTSALLQNTKTGGLRTHIRVPTDSETTSAKLPFQSWGQIFEVSDSDTDAVSARRLRDATQEVTCWGSGRLNIRRASDETVRLVCEAQVSSEVVSKILSLRREPGEHRLDDILTLPAPKIRDRFALQRLLSDESKCHSLWIFVESERREWVTLVIDRPGKGFSTQQLTFFW